MMARKRRRVTSGDLEVCTSSLFVTTLRRFKVSTLVILRRMRDAGLNVARFHEAYDNEVERLRALSAGSGGNFYLTLGAPLELAGRSVRSNLRKSQSTEAIVTPTSNGESDGCEEHSERKCDDVQNAEAQLRLRCDFNVPTSVGRDRCEEREYQHDDRQ
jgi:hypothetical protein